MIILSEPGMGWAGDPELAPLIDGDGARAYYRVGYFNCARSAAHDLMKAKGKNRSAMPVLFLYRHYIELALKDGLAAAGAFDIKISDEKFGHHLDRLWVEGKKVLSNFVDKQQLSELDGLVAEFHSVDGRADAFRYAVNVKGERHFKGYGSVNLKELLSRMDVAEALLERAIKTIHDDEKEMDVEIARAVAKDPY